MKVDIRRARIIHRLRETRAEVEQIFIDTDHWNQCVRKPNEQPIDPDPDGEMRRLSDAIARVLAADPGYGPIASLDWKPGKQA
jgi:hypothetical protein